MEGGVWAGGTATTTGGNADVRMSAGKEEKERRRGGV